MSTREKLHAPFAVLREVAHAGADQDWPAVRPTEVTMARRQVLALTPHAVAARRKVDGEVGLAAQPPGRLDPKRTQLVPERSNCAAAAPPDQTRHSFGRKDEGRARSSERPSRHHAHERAVTSRLFHAARSCRDSEKDIRRSIGVRLFCRTPTAPAKSRRPLAELITIRREPLIRGRSQRKLRLNERHHSSRNTVRSQRSASSSQCSA